MSLIGNLLNMSDDLLKNVYIDENNERFFIDKTRTDKLLFKGNEYLII